VRGTPGPNTGNNNKYSRLADCFGHIWRDLAVGLLNLLRAAWQLLCFICGRVSAVCAESSPSFFVFWLCALIVFSAARRYLCAPHLAAVFAGG
jgi:hypothetical protein